MTFIDLITVSNLFISSLPYIKQMSDFFDNLSTGKRGPTKYLSYGSVIFRVVKNL